MDSPVSHKKSKKSKHSSNKSKKSKHVKKHSKKSKHYDSSNSDSDSSSGGWVEKKKKYKRSSSSESSSSASESDGWVVKKKGEKKEKQWAERENTKTDEPPARDDWMDVDSLIPTYSKKDITRKQKEEAANQKLILDRPGQSEQELNPYWKDGGKGLPEEEKKSSVTQSSVGDGGVSWLRKAYQRAIEQSKEEGRSLADIAAERWGSLEKIENMLREAEEVRVKPRFARPTDDWGEGRGGGGRKLPFAKPSGGRRDNYDERPAWKKRGDGDKPWKKRDNDRDDSDNAWRKKRDDSRDRDRDNSRDRDRNILRRRDRGDSRERDRDNDREKSQSYRSRDSRSPDVTPKRDERKYGCEMKPPNDSPVEGKYERDRDISSGKSRSESPVPQKPTEVVKALTELERNEIGAKIIKAELRGDTKLASELKLKLEASKSVKATGSAKTSEKLSEKELNQLSAKIMKAELMGDTKLVNELKEKFEKAKSTTEEVVVLATTSREGFTRPLYESEDVSYAKHDSRRKKRKVETHRGGQRERYFADDDKYSLKDMFEKEKLTNAEDHNAEFARIIGKDARKANSDFDIDDIFEAKSNREDKNAQVRMRDRAINEHKTVKKSLESCQWCIDGKEIQKHLIISASDKAFLSLPSHNSLTTGHCVIAPVSHVPCGTQLDEDVWEEVQKYRKEIVKMFQEQDLDVVFMETAMRLKHFPHMTLHCIPMPRETGDLAPIYFKKAINECEQEWANNIKLVDLKGKDVRSAVPKGLPYFSVDFGLQSGFAHVIEDEMYFPHYFGAEIIGGMLDLDPYLWRKPRKENFDVQCKKSVEFTKWWQPHEFN